MQSQNLILLTYLNTFLENTSEAVLLISRENGDYRLLLVNERFAGLSNNAYSTHDQGRLISDIVPAESYAGLKSQYDTVAAKQVPVVHTSHDQVGGETRTYRTKFIPILDAFEECTHIVAVVEDITELKTLRSRVKELEAKLRTVKQ